MTKQIGPSLIRRAVIVFLLGLLIAGGFVLWLFLSGSRHWYGFQPMEMGLAQYTPKDVIGNLGGMKVRIPRHYAEYVEYDADPGFGEKRNAPPPERTYKSNLRSFGIDVRFPDMKGKETRELKDHYRSQFLRPESPWLSIGVIAGQFYPSLGAYANDGLAKYLFNKSEFWFSNFERAKDLDIADLEAYVVAGADPRSGKPARFSDSTHDIYIHKTDGHVDTYIKCGRTSVPGGVATCAMHFGLEPRAKVSLSTSFRPALLPQWRAIRESVTKLFFGFEVEGTQ